MAVSASVTVGGVLRAVWDDDVEDYVEYAADGTTETLRRAYTAVELAQKGERLTRATTLANLDTLTAKAATAVAAVRGSARTLTTARNRTDNQLAGNTAATASSLRSLADAVILTQDAVVAVAKVVARDLASTDTGPS